MKKIPLHCNNLVNYIIINIIDYLKNGVQKHELIYEKTGIFACEFILNGQTDSCHPISLIVTYLLENGCNINEKDNDEYTSLLLASQGGHLEIVKYLLENGSNINEKSIFKSSCILIASYNGHLEIVKYLVNEQGCS